MKYLKETKNLVKKVLFFLLELKVAFMGGMNENFQIFNVYFNGIFLVIYQQSNRKGLNRLCISIRIAVIISATLGGLIGDSAKAVESSNGHNNQVNIPRGGFISMNERYLKPHDINKKTMSSLL